MEMETQQNIELDRDARLDTDDWSDIDSIMERLSDASFGQSIIDAARLAMARHMLQTAQDNQAAVEAENSTHLA